MAKAQAKTKEKKETSKKKNPEKKAPKEKSIKGGTETEVKNKRSKKNKGGADETNLSGPDAKDPEIHKEEKLCKLKITLSEEEIIQQAHKFGIATKELTKIEGEEKVSKDDFKRRKAEQKLIISNSAAAINQGEEEREVKCRVEYHFPKPDLKTIYRLDTENESLFDTVEMTPEDYKLPFFVELKEDENKPETDKEELLEPPDKDSINNFAPADVKSKTKIGAGGLGLVDVIQSSLTDVNQNKENPDPF